MERHALREEGFARATTNRIAARAGVNVALLYRYFAGKEAIVGALIERIAETTYEAVRDALAENATEPLPIVVRAMLEALIDTAGVQPDLHRELVEHVDIAKRREVVQRARARAAELFRALVAERAAELRPLADPDALVFVLQHALEASTHAAAFYRPEGLSAERAREAISELVLRVLLPDPCVDPP